MNLPLLKLALWAAVLWVGYRALRNFFGGSTLVSADVALRIPSSSTTGNPGSVDSAASIDQSGDYFFIAKPTTAQIVASGNDPNGILAQGTTVVAKSLDDLQRQIAAYKRTGATITRVFKFGDVTANGLTSKYA